MERELDNAVRLRKSIYDRGVVVEQTYSIAALTECITRCEKDDDAEFLVAEDNGEVVGYLHYDCDGAEPELHRIYVDLERKRAGIGSALMRALHARLRPGSAYVLLVAEQNTPTLARSTSGMA